MLSLRTVVAAIDFSPGAAVALVRAADLARRSGAVLHLLHADVLFHASGDGAAPDAVPASALRVRVERFAMETLGLRDADGLDRLEPTVAVVRDVSVHAAVLRYLGAVNPDLLVVGTHGRSGLSRALLGSVAEALVASAPCPVLTVPERGAVDGPGPEAPVLVGVDFSERSRGALAAGCVLAEATGAPVEVVHVVRDAGPYPGLAPHILSLVDFDPEQGAAVRERLERFAATVCSPAALHVGLGAPGRLVAALASERGAGAVVLGTHGRTGLARLIGSVSEAVIRRAPCPVLTLQEAASLRSSPRPVAATAPPLPF
ncbi:hypothetical protein B1759_04545 [Rubrivirga sp. SAORIC476]|uniref:universal stress protein n=1 Tax=Rubrivirga sp. SAORIC476 TaxID=1961794 RepID=UPI000BCE1A74|nr:universal stress protein [Rubrivirga sp. SAORIC476]PAP80652.1 hypothetical protein B1759_04545 [Rubrivirga sp. SAORIC476]